MSTITLFVDTPDSASFSLDFSTGSPYELANNDVTGKAWTPTAVEKQLIKSGGPPFSIGEEVVNEGYANVQEAIPFQIKAANHDTIVGHLRTLRRALSACTMMTPGRLSFLPSKTGESTATASIPTVYEIFSGRVQELSSFVADEAGRGTLRGTMYLERAPFGSTAEATVSGNVIPVSELLLNATQVGNSPSASPDNAFSFQVGVDLSSDLRGDRSYAGQPIRMLLASRASGVFASAGIQRAYVWTGVATATSVATAMSTSSTSGVQVGSNIDFTHTPVRGTRMRICATITSPSSNLEIRARVIFSDGSTAGGAIYTSPWIAPGSSTTYVDLGFYDLPAYFARGLVGAGIRYILEARSTNGGSVSGTWTRLDRIQYYTWARITSTVSLTAPTLVIQTAAVVGDGISGPQAIALLQQPYVAFTLSSVAVDYPEVRGGLPICLQDSGIGWIGLTAGVYDSTDTANLTVTNYPLYETWVGNDT